MMKLFVYGLPTAVIAVQLNSMFAPTATSAVSSQAAIAPAPTPNTQNLSPDSLYAKINPRVVKIEVGKGSGSGTIAAGNLITTCFHVVSGGGEITVRMSDKTTTFTATVLAQDKRQDLAVLKVANAPDLPAISLAGGANVGDKVFAFGSPLGKQGAMTEGEILGLTPDITMNAFIDKGNSGGPLINERGEFVGTNCAVVKKNRKIGITKHVDRVKALLGGVS